MKNWVGNIKPYPSMSVSVESHKLEIFGMNIIIGILALFIKKRLSILFFVNSFICYWIFSFFWTSWIENNPYSTSEFTFKIENRNFRLSIDKNPNVYGIYELKPNSKDSLKIIEMGMNEKRGDSIILIYGKSGEIFEMYFYENKLIGLPENPSEIKLKKAE